MKVLQKILSHGLLIAFIVAAFFLYINRAELFPTWFDSADTSLSAAPPVQPAEASSAAVKPTVPGSDAEIPAIEPQTAPVTVEPVVVQEPEAIASYRPLEAEDQQSANPDIPSDNASETDNTPVQTQPDKVEASEYRPLQDEESNNVVIPMSVQVTEDAVVTGEAAVEVDQVPAEPVQPAEHVTNLEAADEEVSSFEAAAEPEAETSEVVVLNAAGDGLNDEALQQRLENARQLYWQRDTRAAATAYESLGLDYPRNTEVWGEIGNFYYSTRQQQPASMAYYRTVSLLIDKGDTPKARQLLSILYKLDAKRAGELDARLQQLAK